MLERIFCIESWLGWCSATPEECKKAWNDDMMDALRKEWRGEGDPPTTYESNYTCWEKRGEKPECWNQ